jgi:nucleoside 2-deoxyribosyltransferase
MMITLTVLKPVRVVSRLTATVPAPLIYIAAPYTEPDPVTNTHKVIRIADALLAAGFAPLIPHLSLAWQLVSPKPYETWLAYDRHLLARCDALLHVPGNSVGTLQECLFADELDIPVIQSPSADPVPCVAAVLRLFSDRKATALSESTIVQCADCDEEQPECTDCQRCHVCCRCGAGEG